MRHRAGKTWSYDQRIDFRILEVHWARVPFHVRIALAFCAWQHTHPEQIAWAIRRVLVLAYIGCYMHDFLGG